MPNIETDARQSYLDGYTSTGAMPYEVYMRDALRQRWLVAWAEADSSPADREAREAGFQARTR